MAERWLELDKHEITTDKVQHFLGQVDNDLWVVSACVDCVVDDKKVQHALLDFGISRSTPVIERCTSIVALTSQYTEPLLSHFDNNPEDAHICCLRSVLLQRLDRLNTYVEMEKLFPNTSELDLDEAEDWDDDPWEEKDRTTTNEPAPQSLSSDPPPILLSEFLLDDLLWSACKITSITSMDALKYLLRRHGQLLWPSRFEILRCIPEFTEPGICRDVFPSLNNVTNAETIWIQESWRPEPDFVELPQVREAFMKFVTPPQSGVSQKSMLFLPVLDPLTAMELSKWYRNRVEVVLSATGMVDVALSLVQHAASQGVPSLDELGEELSLLSRLVYDASYGKEMQEDWTLARWYSMEPMAIVNAYLAYTTPLTVVRDIWRLVMPYLYVIEARAERAGNVDPLLHTRILYDYILSTSLDNAAAIFEASKPTLPLAQRLIKNDEDMSRLALASLYGNTSLDKWTTMSGIFECLPAWELSEDDRYAASAEATLASLTNFVIPSTNKSPPSPRDLFTFFEPLPFTVLSRALDLLDVHLESGEVLSKWNVSAPLRWLLQSTADANEQRSWANKMARLGTVHKSQPNNSVEDCEKLLNDMLKLTGSGDTSARGAFCLLSDNEIMRIFLNALLSSGQFNTAKTMLNSSDSNLFLTPEEVESVCLICSRELYDNARAGNYKSGDMKLAYECLDVPGPSAVLTKEKEFIEATSRITSFNVLTTHGAPMSPIEIRLTKDRLLLISRVLSSNSDAYRHAEVILDLCNKLGYRGDPFAEVRVLAMLADTALQLEDFDYAYGTLERMIALVSSLKSGQVKSDDQRLRDVANVCWVACFQLGRQSEFLDVEKRMVLLGNALEICPPDQIHDVLTAWRKIETEDIQQRQERLRSQPEPDPRFRNLNGGTSSLRARLQDFHMPAPPLLSTPDAAALATRTFKTVTANFPFSVGHRPRADTEESTWADGGDISSQASKVLSKGLGWLIGADNET